MSVILDLDKKPHICMNDRDILDFIEEKCGSELKELISERIESANLAEKYKGIAEDFEIDNNDLKAELESVENSASDLSSTLDEISRFIELEKTPAEILKLIKKAIKDERGW